MAVDKKQVLLRNVMESADNPLASFEKKKKLSEFYKKVKKANYNEAMESEYQMILRTKWNNTPVLYMSTGCIFLYTRILQEYNNIL